VSLSVRIFRSDRSCLLLVLPAALLLVSFNLAGRDLWDPDEPRTGEVAREILQSDSWSVLHDDGRPYLEKPPLYFWSVAALSLPAGRVNELTARLPAALSGILGVLCLYYFARALYGRRTGALSGLVLVTTHGYIMEARWAHPDMLWTLCLTFACFAFHRAYRAGPRGPWLVAFYAALGMAALTKGPAALVLAALALLVFLAASRDLGFLRRAGLAWGIPLALLPTGLWLAAYGASAGHRFPVGWALARISERFFTGLHHPRPFLHILTSLPLEFLPWFVFLPGAVWHTLPRAGRRADPDTIYLYSWITAYIVVFALSVEKRGVYLLPLLPLLAILIGRIWDTALYRWEPSPVEGTLRAGLGAGLLLAVGASAYVLPRLRREMPDLRDEGAWLATTAILTVVAASLIHRYAGGGAGLGALTAGLVACQLLIAATVLPALDAHKSARAFSLRVAAAARGAPLGIYPDYHAAYVFYGGRTLELLRTRDELAAFVKGAPRVYCLMEASRYEVERRLLGATLRVIDRDRIGHRAMLLVEGTDTGREPNRQEDSPP
jgi:4-amino-4-deoxy-L-arabinose transferase-like glycosyltransferase